MCAGIAGQRGKRVLLLDHARKIGEKIRISGGGRCNFTNVNASPKQYLSQNPHFCRNALAAYGPAEFVKLVQAHGIAYHEKVLGQLFCDGSAEAIIDMLLDECRKGDVTLRSDTGIESVSQSSSGFEVVTDKGTFTAARLIVATGGKSIPKIGASGFGYALAEQFGLPLVSTRAGLVPLTFDPTFKARFAPLAGVSVDATVTANGATFREALLFTHRGLSGPAILQASSFWREGDSIRINLLPDTDIYNVLLTERDAQPRTDIATVLAQYLPKRLARILTDDLPPKQRRLADLSNKRLKAVADDLTGWTITPVGSEGYRTAEVTLGGVDTDALHPKTLEARDVPGLHFIGEVVDVTGWLGGYNFQWAWSSAVAAARAL